MRWLQESRSQISRHDRRLNESRSARTRSSVSRPATRSRVNPRLRKTIKTRCLFPSVAGLEGNHEPQFAIPLRRPLHCAKGARLAMTTALTTCPPDTLASGPGKGPASARCARPVDMWTTLFAPIRVKTSKQSKTTQSKKQSHTEFLTTQHPRTSSRLNGSPSQTSLFSGGRDGNTGSNVVLNLMWLWLPILGAAMATSEQVTPDSPTADCGADHRREAMLTGSSPLTFGIPGTGQDQ